MPSTTWHSAAFAKNESPNTLLVEATPVGALGADDGWLPALSLVAADMDGRVVGHLFGVPVDLHALTLEIDGKPVHLRAAAVVPNWGGRHL